MVYSIDEIRKIVEPIAKKYSLKAVYLFGSYARDEATEDSDVDILIDRTGSTISGMLDMGGLYNELKEKIGKEIDLVTTHTLEQRSTRERVPSFVNNLNSGRILLYANI